MKKNNETQNDENYNILLEYQESIGLNKNLLEARNLKAVTELAIQSTKSLKRQNLINFCFLIFGSLFTFFITNLFGNKDNSELLRLLNNQNTEITYLKKNFQNNLNEQNIKLLELKKQVSELKKN